ncbi:hypothetical protein D3C86_1710240 [compost metagenome]
MVPERKSVDIAFRSSVRQTAVSGSQQVGLLIFVKSGECFSSRNKVSNTDAGFEFQERGIAFEQGKLSVQAKRSIE